MGEYTLSAISHSDRLAMAELDALLAVNGLDRDPNLDYTVGLYNDDYELIATGSASANTLRCFAIDSRYQGEGLLNSVVTHLYEWQYARGNYHLFLYTKPKTAPLFSGLGFYEIERVADKLVFMENTKNGFEKYLKILTVETEKALGPERAANPPEKTAGIVMNANPFTKGHQYLVEQAAAVNDLVHLFVVSEDRSFFPAAVRMRLVKEGTAHLPNVIVHKTEDYMISSAVFPSYFLRSEAAVIEAQATLDATIFARIAKALSIRARFLGEEPTSIVTSHYNRVLTETLPKYGIACNILPRKESDGKAISASVVRQRLAAGDFVALGKLLPECTLNYLLSPESSAVRRAILNATEVTHY